jgi:hypothetical protein
VRGNSPQVEINGANSATLGFMILTGSVQESRDEALMRIAYFHIPDAGLEGH